MGLSCRLVMTGMDLSEVGRSMHRWRCRRIGVCFGERCGLIDSIKGETS
jgi:hypothetical protein